MLARAQFLTGCCCSVIKSCPTLCDLMDCSMPAIPGVCFLSELAQIHVHWVSDAIQSSYPLSLPSLHALNISQHQGLFQWVCSSHQVAKVLEHQLQQQSFQWAFRVDSFRIDWFDLLQSKGLSKEVIRELNHLYIPFSSREKSQISRWQHLEATWSLPDSSLASGGWCSMRNIST